MPTDAVQEILPGGLGLDVQDVLDTLAGGITEVVNFGTHVLVWYDEANAGKTDEAAPTSLLLRHFIEMIDSVSILVRSSAIEPTQVLLRSAFEAAIQLEWIIRDDTDRRAMAFMTWHVHQRLKYYTRLDRSTSEGRELAKKLKGTMYDGIDLRDKFDLESARANLKILLKKPLYRETAAEYEVVRKNSRNPRWYQLFGGPRSVEQLANQVKMPEFYELLYRSWSGVAHATDVVAGKVSSREGVTQIHQIRSPERVESVYSIAIGLSIRIYKVIMDKYVPDGLNTIQKWYTADVYPLSTRVSQGPLITIIDN